jgi:arylsulfatase A-like enzyme
MYVWLLLGGALAAAEPMNVLMIAVDDLRPSGAAFSNDEILTPNINKHFLTGNGTAFQHSYVQFAWCGPSRASILTSRRPDTTHVGTGKGSWCWCQRNNKNITRFECDDNQLFMTLPTYFRQQGFTTAGVGKIFHPDACAGSFNHTVGDDPRAYSYYDYGVEANRTQEQWGSIPGPHDKVFNGTMGLSFYESPLPDAQQTDGMLATNAVLRFANFSRDGIGKKGANKPFFHAVGFHKPHLPHVGTVTVISFLRVPLILSLHTASRSTEKVLRSV